MIVMSDYQKLKTKYDNLKVKSDKQSLLIKQLKEMLMTMLNYNNLVKNKIIRLIDLTEGEE